MIYKTNKTKEFFTPERCHIIEILNDEVAPNMSIAQARVEPGVYTQLHALQGIDESYYILQGKGEIEIGHKSFGIVKTGDVVFIPKDKSQRIKNIGDEDLIFLCICVKRFTEKCYLDLENDTLLPN